VILWKSSNEVTFGENWHEITSVKREWQTKTAKSWYHLENGDGGILNMALAHRAKIISMLSSRLGKTQTKYQQKHRYSPPRTRLIMKWQA